MTTITQLERDLSDIDETLIVARRTVAALEDERRRKAEELEAARWAELSAMYGVDLPFNGEIIMTKDIRDHVLSGKSVNKRTWPTGRTAKFFIGDLVSDTEIMIWKDRQGWLGYIIPAALIADARREWLAAREANHE